MAGTNDIQSSSSQPPEHRLGPRDAAALDALVSNRFQAKAEPAQQAIARLLGTLRAGPTPDPALVDVTLAQIQSSARDQQRAEALDGATLTPDAAESLDAWMSEHGNAQRVPGELRVRATKASALAALVSQTHAPAGGRELLIERTLQSITTSREQEPALRAPLAGGMRLRDVISIAATLLLGVSVLWPIFSTVRRSRERSACETNMAGIGSAMGLYSGDFDGQLPTSHAALAGTSWLSVGDEAAPGNSANLFTLAREQYATIALLACRGNPHAAYDMTPGSRDWRASPEVSYSYYVLAGGPRPSWRQNPGTVVLADRSPVALRAMAGMPIEPEANSANHAGSGQWALFLDGSSRWLRTPMLTTATGPDNIWLPLTIEEALHNAGVFSRATGATQGRIALPTEAQAQSQKMLRMFGTLTPGSVQDSFVAP